MNAIGFQRSLESNKGVCRWDYIRDEHNLRQWAGNKWKGITVFFHWNDIKKNDLRLRLNLRSKSVVLRLFNFVSWRIFRRWTSEDKWKNSSFFISGFAGPFLLALFLRWFLLSALTWLLWANFTWWLPLYKVGTLNCHILNQAVYHDVIMLEGNSAQIVRCFFSSIFWTQFVYVFCLVTNSCLISTQNWSSLILTHSSLILSSICFGHTSSTYCGPCLLCELIVWLILLDRFVCTPLWVISMWNCGQRNAHWHAAISCSYVWKGTTMEQYSIES